MVYIIIDGEFHYEKIHIPFGHMVILRDDAIHGGCMGSHGSFRFHFAIKCLKGLGSERLIHKSKEIEKHFYKEFPDIRENGNALVVDASMKKTDEVINNLVAKDYADKHMEVLDKESKECNIVHLVYLLE